MDSYSHLGTGFEVWNDQQTWFWMVVDPRRKRAAIGAAASEAEALREARWSIEARATAARITGRKAWTCALRNLAQYLACLNRATV